MGSAAAACNGLAALDIAETKDAVEISTELPGVDEGDVKVSVDGQSIVISGEKKSETEEKNKAWHVVERSYGAFRRVVPLTFTPDAAKIKATFDKGILRVTVGKPPEMVAKKVDIPIGKARHDARSRRDRARPRRVKGIVGVAERAGIGDQEREREMAYKDIMVYLDATGDTQDRLRLAVAMAMAHGARLIGVDASSTRRSSARGATGRCTSARNSRRRSRTPGWSAISSAPSAEPRSAANTPIASI